MKAERAAPLNTEHARSTDTRSTELTRAHALNWAGSVVAIGLCAMLALFVGLRAINVNVSPKLFVYLLPLPLLIGICVGSIKLIQFTEEHRDFLYRVEEATGVDLDLDGEIGRPRAETEALPGTLVRGVDGAFHRIDTVLTAPEIHAIKRLLLTAEKATVRALTGIVGDRASQLRQELITLGICEAAAVKSAARLSADGKKAVMRW